MDQKLKGDSKMEELGARCADNESHIFCLKTANIDADLVNIHDNTEVLESYTFLIEEERISVASFSMDSRHLEDLEVAGSCSIAPLLLQ